MNLPDMGVGITSRERIRVGGGYAAPATGVSPAGGLDIDPAGHLATDGDVTIDGGLSGGAGLLVADPVGSLVTAQDTLIEGEFSITGKDLVWSEFLHAADGFPASNSGCSAIAQTQVRLREVEFRSLDFAIDINQRALFNFVLPDHYSGGALQVDLFWTYSSGTAGDDTRWVVNMLCLGDDDPMDQNVNPGIGVAEQEAIAAHRMHKATLTLTPVNAAAGDYCNVVVIRNGNHANDQFDGSTQLIALRIGFA